MDSDLRHLRHRDESVGERQGDEEKEREGVQDFEEAAREVFMFDEEADLDSVLGWGLASCHLTPLL